VAEPLGRAMAPAAATQWVRPAGLHARHEVAPVALQATLQAAAVHATPEVARPAAAVHATPEAARPAAVGPVSHLQPELRTA
jgi:hypothetical protein